MYATLAGPLRVDDQSATSQRWWVSETRRRYIPQLNDVVVGMVVEQLGESYVVDINGPRYASLDSLGFDGASRRNCPDLQAGALVFARVVRAMNDVEPQLTCLAGDAAAKKDWTSGEAAFGELRGGTVFEVARATCRALSLQGAVLLESLGRAFPYELAVGLNGRVWVSADHDPACVVLVGSAMRACAGRDLGGQDADALVKQLLRAAGLAQAKKKRKANAEEQEGRGPLEDDLDEGEDEIML
jgi:exosome complex component RRP40